MNETSHPQILYRTADETDFPAITSLYTKLNDHFYTLGFQLPRPENVGQVWLESFQRTLGRFSNAWVAEVDQQVIGFILCRIKRLPAYMGGVMVGELSDEWIEPEFRRLKVGDRLCRIALDWLREQNVHSVEIQVLAPNEASWNMLARIGFKLEFRVGRLYWDTYQQENPSANETS